MSQTDVRPHGPAAGVETSEVAQTFGVEAAVGLSQAEASIAAADARCQGSGRVRRSSESNGTTATTSSPSSRRLVAHEGDTYNIEKVRQAAVEVITIEIFELGTGRGGEPRMRCPLTRDPV